MSDYLQWQIKGVELNLGVVEILNDVSENFEQITYFSVGYRITF